MGMMTASYEKKNWLVRSIAWRITPALILLSLITLLSAGLHFYNIQSIGDSNTYYTAAVKSMLQSWSNFFFVSAEPGGSVTIDKPPLGLWLEAASAALLGVSGFSVVLPNILAGVLSVPLLYHLVKKCFGVGAGLAAALVLALTPVSLAVDRNNTIDGMLNFTLLLAAWAFIKATETGRLKHVLLGAFLVGLGFNIKMMQAFLPLPAFYALYFFGSKAGWRRKLVNLILASLLLVVVSLSWAVAVDLTPASQRPYVGSTSTNSEMELIFGYNGVNRLLGMMGGRMRPAAAQPQANFPALPGLGGWDGGGRQGGGGGMFNTGTPGALRFFQAPLAKEMSWLLPFALLVIMLGIAFGFMEGGGLRRFRLPLLSETHKALVLWGGWLLTCLVFFSIAGFFHNYYLATLSPALAALIGVGVYLLHQLAERNRLLAVLSLLVICAGTLVFQLYLVSLFGLYGVWAYLSLGFCGLALVVSIVAVLRKSAPQAVFNAAVMAALVGMLIIPGLWSFRTVASGTSGTLPEAYSGDHSNNRVFGNPGPGGAPGDGNFGDSANSALVSYLQENTQNIKYLVAVPSSHNGSDLVLETGRPVLFMGGFSGSDPVLDANGLARLVNQGELRYVMTGGQGGPGGSSNSDISNWVQNNCHLVDNLTQSSGGMRGGSTLYDCGS